jgi:hypothetical protein
MTAVGFDVDGPSHDASEPWRAEKRPEIETLFAAHPGGFAHETAHGFRIVYAVEPVTIATEADAIEWSRNRAVEIAYLARRFGIVCDPSCVDSTRLFRAPHATRDGVLQRRPSLGDASAIGPLQIEPTEDDRIEAQRICPKAWASPRTPNYEGPSPSSLKSGGRGAAIPFDDEAPGALFAALEAQGLIVRRKDAAAFVVRCPNRARHSTGSDGDGSTIFFLPHSRGRDGAVCCLHASCAGMSAADWRTVLGASDVEVVEATIAEAHINGAGRETRLALYLTGDDQIFPRWLNVEATSGRWAARFDACDLDVPDVSDARDVRQQTRGLVGAIVALEVDRSDGRRTPVRRLLRPSSMLMGMAAE